MEAIDNLMALHRDRLHELIEPRKEGKKVIGYTPGGYLPEELVLASGAIPVCLIRGGDRSPSVYRFCETATTPDEERKK